MSSVMNYQIRLDQISRSVMSDSLRPHESQHSSILAWEILWIEGPDRQQSTGSQRVRHDLASKQQQQKDLSL